MKFTLLLIFALLATIPASAQPQSSCKAFFQVVRADAATPGLRAGMDEAQKKWWDSKGQKKFPGLCLDGSATSVDKPRYLVIWSRSKTIAQTPTAPNPVYGQSAAALQGTAPMVPIYQPRWNMASVTIATVSYNGTFDIPPVYFQAGDRAFPLLLPDSPKVLDAALKYLQQAPDYSSKLFCPASLEVSY